MSDMSGIISVFVAGGFFGGCIVLAYRRRADRREPQIDTSVDAEGAEQLKATIEELIDNLKAVADDAVAKIDARKKELARVLNQAEKILGERSPSEADVDAALRMARDGATDQEIAQRAGLSRAEIGFLKNLHSGRYESENKTPQNDFSPEPPQSKE
jgi:hypothetical protein